MVLVAVLSVFSVFGPLSAPCFAAPVAFGAEDAPASPIDGPKGQRFEKKPPPPPPEPAAPLLPRRAAQQGWIGWSLGSGYGWYGAGPLEQRTDLRVDAGFAPTTLGHFGAELGVQWNEDWAFSLHTRHQVIPRQGGSRGGTPHQWAHAAFVRGVHIFAREGAQLFAGGLVGGGQGFRFRIDAQPGRLLTTSDTVRGGPLMAGPVGGFVLPLLPKLSITGEARLVVGFPDKAAALELNLGAQFDLFTL